MATLKCKMCGGDLELTPDVTVAECPYCGTKQTVPNADNEKKMTLFTRANRLRFNCEFDKAAGVYETIIAEFPEEAEAYWGLVLCKYGIEYVDDPATGKKIPTCHRSSFDSVMEDENFELATEYADTVAKRVYRDEAKQIEDIRKGIIEVSSKEEPYDVFICYKETGENGERTLDSVLAQDIYDALTEKGYRVFFSRITLEDKLGQAYEPYIFAALHSARVMLAVGTSYEHYDAVWVKNEWSRYLQLIAAGEKKTLIPCYKNLDAYDMPKEFAKLQAQDMGKVGALQDLLRGVDKIIGKNAEKADFKGDSAAVSQMPALSAQTASLLKRGYNALEDCYFDEADKIFGKVLNNDAECSQAYMGKVLVYYEIRNFKDLINKFLISMEDNKEGKKIYLPEVNLMDLVEQARKAESKTGLLSYFTDDELLELMRRTFRVAAIEDYSYEAYYKEELEKYGREAALADLIDSSDFKRAKKYADEETRQQIHLLWEELTEGIKTRMQEEKQKLENYKAEQEREKELMWHIISERLKNAEKDCEEWNAEVKEAIETEYQRSVACQKAAYQRCLENWEVEKERYSAAVAKQLEQQEKLMQLKEEKAQLKGFFIGKKRRELEKNIAELQLALNTWDVPQAPGERPVQEEPLARESFSASSKIGRKIIKGRICQTVFSCDQIVPGEMEKIKKASVGDIVSFGRYACTVDAIKTPLQWRILEKKEGCVFLLTEKGIDVKPYNEKKDDVTWETCTLRKWLNTTFIDKAFTAWEQKYIRYTSVDNSKIQGNRKYKTNGGNKTGDRVFLLSYKEAFKDYFANNEERRCCPTDYAFEKDGGRNSVSGGINWWLRSPDAFQDCVQFVNSWGGEGENYCSSKSCVRPALWIDLSSDIF